MNCNEIACKGYFFATMAYSNHNGDHENENNDFGEQSLTRTRDKTLKHLAMFTETQLRNLNEGKVLYNSGVKQGFRWRSICYKNQNFRAYYAMKMFPARFDIVRRALENAVDDSVITATFLRSVKKVVSFGCGPGSELYAVKRFLAESFPHRVQHYSKVTGPHFVGYDNELGWLLYLDQLGLEFECQEVDEEFLRSMPDVGVNVKTAEGANNSPRFRRRLPANIPSVSSMSADVIIMSHFNVASSFFRHTNWDVVLKKAKFIMVIDVSDAELHTTLMGKGFSHFQFKDLLQNDVNVYCLKV